MGYLVDTTDPASPQPLTHVTNGDGTQAISYVVPALVGQALDSVYVEIDATAAGNTTATLTVTNELGQVIARKAQAQAVTGGAPGSATWALRLTDETGGATPAAGTVFVEGFVQDNLHGTVVPAINTASLPWVKASGNDLFDLTDPLLPVALADGWYTFTATVFFQDHAAGDPPNGTALKAFLNFFLGSIAPIGQQNQIAWSSSLPGANGVNLAHTTFLPAGAVGQLLAGNGWDPAGQSVEAFYGLTVAFEPFSLAP